MSVDCVDLTSDPELDLTADVQPRTKAPGQPPVHSPRRLDGTSRGTTLTFALTAEVLSLLSDSDDAGSPLKQANSSAGMQKRSFRVMY